MASESGAKTNAVDTSALGKGNEDGGAASPHLFTSPPETTSPAKPVSDRRYYLLLATAFFLLAAGVFWYLGFDHQLAINEIQKRDRALYTSYLENYTKICIPPIIQGNQTFVPAWHYDFNKTAS